MLRCKQIDSQSVRNILIIKLISRVSDLIPDNVIEFWGVACLELISLKKLDYRSQQLELNPWSSMPKSQHGFLSVIELHNQWNYFCFSSPAKYHICISCHQNIINDCLKKKNS